VSEDVSAVPAASQGEAQPGTALRGQIEFFIFLQAPRKFLHKRIRKISVSKREKVVADGFDDFGIYRVHALSILGQFVCLTIVFDCQIGSI
jgi:hypothetical protein